MPKILILADDLTGAADTGAQFARSGLSTLLLLEPIEPSPTAVLVLTSESRERSETAAVAAVRSVLMDLSQHHPLIDFNWIYKKIDSTLRGHPEAELRELLRLSGESRVLVAPAYPAQGRTTRNGVVLVHNIPLSQTSFAVEAVSGDLSQRFGANTTLLPLSVVRQGDTALAATLQHQQGIILADAETDADLLSLAQAAVTVGMRLFCGSAGLAWALTRVSSTIHGDPQTPLLIDTSPQAIPPQPGYLAVAGSLHAATVAQVRYAQRHGVEVVTPGDAFLLEPGNAEIFETAHRLASIYRSGKPVILATAILAPNPNRLSNQEIAARLAQIAVYHFAQHPPAGLFLTGGDTALGVCRALGCTQLWLGGEVEPGMPWSRSGSWSIVTKAGGFGHENAVLNGLNWLRDHPISGSG